MSKDQKRLMEDPDKLLKEARTPLTRLFRSLLAKRHMDPVTWNNRLTLYLASPHSDCPNNSKDIGQERNNFNRAISKPEITFRTFFKALPILGYSKYSMTLTAIDTNGEKVEITTPFWPNPIVNLYTKKGILTGDKENVTTPDPIGDFWEPDDDSEDAHLQMEMVLEETLDQLPDSQPARRTLELPRRRTSEVRRPSSPLEEN